MFYKKSAALALPPPPLLISLSLTSICALLGGGLVLLPSLTPLGLAPPLPPLRSRLGVLLLLVLLLIYLPLFATGDLDLDTALIFSLCLAIRWGGLDLDLDGE